MSIIDKPVLGGDIKTFALFLVFSFIIQFWWGIFYDSEIKARSVEPGERVLFRQWCAWLHNQKWIEARAYGDVGISQWGNN